MKYHPMRLSKLTGVVSVGNMGKNKQKGKKQKNVFQVANKHLKPKNKAKPVTTTLKHVRSIFCMYSLIFYMLDLL